MDVLENLSYSVFLSANASEYMFFVASHLCHFLGYTAKVDKKDENRYNTIRNPYHYYGFIEI